MMETVKVGSVAMLALVLVLCISSTSVTWYCLNQVARLQSRVERLETECSSISQLLGQIEVQTPVYQETDGKEESPGHQQEIRQGNHQLHKLIQLVELEADLGSITNTGSKRSKKSTLTPRQWTPLKGQKGDPGQYGPPGPPGIRGPPGRLGRKGNKGDQGVPGVRGNTGDMGSTGVKGERGDTGLTGPAGQKGDIGSSGQPGVQGPKGEKGERGDTGPVGTRGQPGDIGLKGSPGEKGQKGEEGEKGDTGRQDPGEMVVPPCGSGSWTRVAYLNMTDPSQQCPSTWREISTPKRVCGKRSGVSTCDSVAYATSGMYDKVCGRIKGYQHNGPDAFFEYSNDRSITIDSYYVDGVSVTHGQPRQHIWTFAAGAGEENDAQWICPCANPTKSAVITVPPFVGNNYFCEAGLTRYAGSFDGFYPDDPLWDGDGCGPSSSCCSLNSPPWFSVQLPAPTTDDIEVRLCDNNLGGSDDIPIEEIEIYVL